LTISGKLGKSVHDQYQSFSLTFFGLYLNLLLQVLICQHNFFLLFTSFSDPTNHFILGNLSHVYLVLEEYQTALDYADRACKKIPNWEKVGNETVKIK
jgi:hypothetical protein